MKCIFSGSWAQDPEIFRTLEGKTVSVTCLYHPSYISHEKIWCKRIPDNFCKLPVQRDSTGAKKLRFSIQNSWYNSFTAIMTELKLSDSGVYHCGILGNSGNITVLRTILLVVSGGEFPPSILLSAFLSLKAPELERTQDTASSSKEVLKLWGQSPTGVSYQIFTL